MASAQDLLTYDFIFESYSFYRDVDEQSLVNPDNKWGLKEHVFKEEFYPIAIFEKDNQKVYLEPKISFSNDAENGDSADLNVQELYYQVKFHGNTSIKAGKQHINWGSGQIWNPTNFYIQKNPLQISNRLEGIEALKLAHEIGNFTLDYIVVPEQGDQDLIGAIKFNAIKDSLSFNGSYAYLSNDNFQVGIDLNYGSDYFTWYSESSLSNYTSIFLVNELGHLTSPKKHHTLSDLYVNSVLGGSLIVTPTVTVAFEYNYRDDFNNEESYKYFLHYLPANGELYDGIGLGRHRIYSSIRYRDEYERFSLSANSFYDFVTGQSTFFPSLQVSRENYKVEFVNYFYNSELPIYKFQTMLQLSIYF